MFKSALIVSFPSWFIWSLVKTLWFERNCFWKCHVKYITFYTLRNKLGSVGKTKTKATLILFRSCLTVHPLPFHPILTHGHVWNWSIWNVLSQKQKHFSRVLNSYFAKWGKKLRRVEKFEFLKNIDMGIKWKGHTSWIQKHIYLTLSNYIEAR